MATADQLKALLKSHAARDDDRFYSIALQVAAKEARRGHNKLATDLKNLVEKSQKQSKLSSASSSKAVQFDRQPKNELSGLLQLTPNIVRSSELVFSEEIKDHLDRVIIEQRQQAKLRQYGLTARRKLLFTGLPGTGKTISASMLATELKLPLYTIVLDSLITRYMGETAAKLRLIFDHISQARAVYLFDEFDAIGTQRGTSNDVGEIRRVLNSFLLFVEQDVSESIIIAATNHPELLDQALYRRFDDIIQFKNPNEKQIRKLIENKLSLFDVEKFNWQLVVESGIGLSSAEVTRSCDDAAKEAVLNNKGLITDKMLMNAFSRRHTSNQLKLK